MPTDKVYIGQTKNMTTRMRQHATQPPRQMLADVQAHKPFIQHFSMTQLIGPLSNKSEANRYEKAYILAYDACNPQKGYNTAPGHSYTLKQYWHIKKNTKS